MAHVWQFIFIKRSRNDYFINFNIFEITTLCQLEVSDQILMLCVGLIKISSPKDLYAMTRSRWLVYSVLCVCFLVSIQST